MESNQRIAQLWREHAGTAILTLMLCASLGVNVFLGRRVYALSPARPASPIKLNSEILPLPVSRIDGSSAVLSFKDTRPVVVYVWMPSCGWCKRNYANIIALHAQTRDRYRFVALTTNTALADARTYLEKHPLPFEAYVVDRDKAGDLPFLQATPTTLVLSNGLVQKSWIGAFQENSLQEVQSFFKVNLPGLPLPGQTGLR